MSGRRRSTDRTIAAVAILRDGLVLAGRRVAPPRVRGGWEFPGGSVEAGETPEQAAVREAREELKVEVELTGRLGRVPIRPGMWLVVFTAVLTGGEPAVNGSHDELRWLGADTLHDLSWLPPDRPLLDPLAELLGPVSPAADDAVGAPSPPDRTPSGASPRRAAIPPVRSRLRPIGRVGWPSGPIADVP